MSIKDDLHRLVDELSESELPAAQRYLKRLHNGWGAETDDPMRRVLMNAPLDDEPSTAEEAEGAAKAWQEYLHGEARPWEEVRDAPDHA